MDATSVFVHLSPIVYSNMVCLKIELFVLLLIENFESIVSASVHKELILNYFSSNNVRQMIYITCPQQESDLQTFKFIKDFAAKGFFVAVSKNDSRTNFTISPNFHNLGIVLDFECPNYQQVLQQAEKKRYFSITYFWIVLTSRTLENVIESFNAIFVPPTSRVLAIYLENAASNKLVMKSLRKIASNLPLTVATVSSPIASRPSKKLTLDGIYLRCALVVAFPDVFTTLDDLKMRHIDTIVRVNYPITSNLRDDLNFRFDMIQVDNYGWRAPNGSFDGLVGRFQRSEVDFSVTALFMRLDRIPVVDFAAETVQIRTCVMFRQPPLSAVTNIFALPFTTEVWIVIFLFMVTTAVAMIGLLNFSQVPVSMSYLDCLHFVWGAICQQGFYMEIVMRSGRILIFTTFVTTLFLFTSFSANIVALLQSPSLTIRTLSDLAASPLEIGVQDTVYNKVFYKETTDPITKKLYEKKIAPKGEAVFMRPELGIYRMRNELFAYQVESQAGYKLISDIFNEMEKCGLDEMEPFKLPMMSISMRKNFPYRELFRQRLRWQREVGLIKREEIRWLPQKPKCENKLVGFISVGIVECRYPLQFFAIGLVVATIVLVGELLYYNVMKRYRLRGRRQWN